MPDLPVIAIVIVAIVGVGGYLIYHRRQNRFNRFFGIGPKTGTEKSVASVVRQHLIELMFDLQTEEGLKDLFSGRASEAPSSAKALQLHADTEDTCQRSLQLELRLAQLVTVAAKFGHVKVVTDLGLQQHLPSQGR